MANLVLTNLDKVCWDPTPGEVFLLNMGLQALQYDYVIIPEQHLIFNPVLADLFVNDDNFSKYFSELFKTTNAFKVKIMSSNRYNDLKIKSDPINCPISARAEYVKLKSGDVGKPFKISDTGREFYKRMDKLLRQYELPNEIDEHLVSRETGPPGVPDSFYKEFVAIISDDKLRTQVITFDHLGRYGNAMAIDALRYYVETPEGRQSGKHLIENKLKYQGDLDSPRNYIYQLAKTRLFSSQEIQLQRLAQSVFASVYCNLEGMDGVYGKNLVETPSRYNSESDVEQASRELEEATSKEVESSGYGILLEKGIGKIIQKIRDNPDLCREKQENQEFYWTEVCAEFRREYNVQLNEEMGNPGAIPIIVYFGKAYMVLHTAFQLMGRLNSGNVRIDDTLLMAFIPILLFDYGRTAQSYLMKAWRSGQTRNHCNDNIRHLLEHYRYHKVPLVSEANTKYPESGQK